MGAHAAAHAWRSSILAEATGTLEIAGQYLDLNDTPLPYSYRDTPNFTGRNFPVVKGHVP